MKRSIALVVPALVFVGAVAAQAAEPVLREGDAEKVIATFAETREELEELGLRIEEESGEMTIPEALAANAEFQKILAAHGWDERFFAALAVVHQAYLVLKMNAAFVEANPQFDEALKAIDANPYLDAETKAGMKKTLLQMVQNVDLAFLEMEGEIHPDDIAAVREHLEALDAVFGE